MINLGVEEMIKQWIMGNIPDFNTKIHTEEDMKIKTGWKELLREQS